MGNRGIIPILFHIHSVLSMNILLCVKGVSRDLEECCSRFFYICGLETQWTTGKVLENTGIHKYLERSGICSLWGFVGKRNGLPECWSVRS